MASILGDGLKRLDGNPLIEKAGEVRAFLVARNESLRLPHVLDYHRKLGIDRFFVVDNQSTDGSTDYLMAQPDVHVFSTQMGYANSNYGVTWLNELLDAYGTGYWTLTIDADELFVYPRCEEADIHRYSRYLESQNAAGVFSLLLDMYSSRPIRETRYIAGTSLIEACPFFDAAPYRFIQITDFPYLQILGGVRERAFWLSSPGGKFISPALSKIPLVKWSTGVKFLSSTHTMTPIPLAQSTSVLLHFKFLHDFHDRALTEAQRGEHYMGAREYRMYHEMLLEKPSLSLFQPASVRFQDSRQFISMGLFRLLDHLKSQPGQ